jgi:hypothetical protein
MKAAFFLLMFGVNVFSFAGTLDFTSDKGGGAGIRVDGQELVGGFNVRLIKPKWQGSYDELVRGEFIKNEPQNSEVKIKAGDFGTWRVDIQRKSPGQIRFCYEFDFSKPIALEVGYITITLPVSLMQTNGSYRINSRDFEKFPAKIQKGFLYSGTASSFSWTNGLGKGLKIVFSGNVFIQFQDSRQWLLPKFELMVQAPVPTAGGKSRFEFTVEPLVSEAKGRAFVDRFGQATTKTWPGKVTSEKELQDDIAKEEAFFQQHRPAGRDEFGGWAGTKEKFNLTGTGFFRAAKAAGRWWLVDPKGNVFFSLASFFITCDAFTVTTNRETLFEWLPAPFAEPWRGAWMKQQDGDCFSFLTANIIRKFGPEYDKKWTEVSRKRWYSWGLNSTSAFSAQLDKVPWTPFLTLVDQSAPSIPGCPSPDVFDPEFPGKLDKLCREMIAPHKNDPYLLGYFFGNEQPVEGIAAAVPMVEGKYAIKQRLVKFLQDRYKTIGDFNRAWNLKAGNFADLVNLIFTPATPEARKDMDGFLELYLDTYGKTLRDTVRKYDPNHLLIGFRWLPGTGANETVAQTMGKYMDVISVNYYTNRFGAGYVNQVSKTAGDRPVILSEWSFGTNERGHIGGCRDTADQTERGYCYRDYVENAAATPAVVGTHWFEYTDMAITGRPWGGANAEAFNTGLIDVTDRPYQELIDALIKTNYRIYEIASGAVKPFKLEEVLKNAKVAPKTDLTKIYHRTGPIVIDGGLNEWLNLEPSVRLIGRDAVFGSPAKARDVHADLWLQWDDQFLYVAARVSDSTPLTNAGEGSGIWNGDAIELFFNNRARDNKGALKDGDWQVLLSPGCPEKKVGPGSWLCQKTQPLKGAEIKSFRKVNPSEWCLEARIPFSNFEGFKPAPGLGIDFDAAVDVNDGPDKPRSVQLIWHGSDSNHFTRAGWGTAKLLP